MNFWKPDGAALTGALSEYVQSPTLSDNTLDYSSDGSTSEKSTPQFLIETPQQPSKQADCETPVVGNSKKLEVLEKQAELLQDVGVDGKPPISLDQDEPLNSFKKREIKCRNIRKSDNSRQRTVSPVQRPKSVEKSKNKYPANWAEYKALGLNVHKHLALKSKLLKKPKHSKFEFKKYFNFETPPPPIETFKSHSKSGVVWIQFSRLRCTTTKPPVFYSSKERGCLSRQQLFALIPKNRQQVMEKLMKPSKREVNYKPPTVRKWFCKNWKTTDKVETGKLLETSVGLSFLQTYSDQETAGNMDEEVVPQTPPFDEEKEEGEVSDDDSHHKPSMIDEIKKAKEELEETKEELEKLEESLKADEKIVDNQVPSVVETTKKKRKKAKTNKVSKSVKSKKKPKKSNSKLEQFDDGDRKRKSKKKGKGLKSKDKDSSRKKKKPTTKKDSKKKKKKKPLDAKPAKLEIHPDYQDDIQFFADRLDAERQLKGKTKHKTKINISLEEFNLDSEDTPTSSQEIKVDLLKMNEEYLREQKRKNSKERSCSKEKSKKHAEVDSVLQNIKQEENVWESEEEVLIDNQLVRTPDPKPLDLEMPLNIKSYCRRDIEKDNVDLQFDIATTPKKGRWDMKTLTPTRKPEELTVLEDEYEEFMKAVTDNTAPEGVFEEIKPVPAPLPKTINLSLSANVTQNITLSVSAPTITSSVEISTPNTVKVSIPENVMSFSIPGDAEKGAALSKDDITANIVLNCEDVTNLSRPAEHLSTPSATSEDVENSTVSEELATHLEEIETIVEKDSIEEIETIVDEDPISVVVASENISILPVDNKGPVSVAVDVTQDSTGVAQIMNLSIPHAVAEKDVVNQKDFVCTNKDVGANQMDFPVEISNSIREEIVNFSIPTKVSPVKNHSEIVNYSMNTFTDKDAFNIPLDKDIDENDECDWKQTFKPIMLPIKNLLGSSKLNLEDFDGHEEDSNQTLEPLVELKRREASASPKRDKKESVKKTSRSQTSTRPRRESPIRKRRDSSPRLRRSRRNSPRSRRPLSPKRRLSPRRRRSPSPRKKSKYSPSRDKKRSPPPRRASPVKHLPDSTISDDQLKQIDNAFPAHVLAKQSQESPQRLPLDIRISQALGLEVQPPAADQFYQYPNNLANVPAARQSTYKQVGNMLQIVPVEEEPQQTWFQHPNRFASQPRSQIRQIGNMLEIVPTEMVPAEAHPQIKTEKIDEDFWQASNETEAKLSAEAAMLQKEAERLAEREKRRTQREKRKKEKERRRKEREKLRQAKLKEKTEKMIKRALELEIDQMLQEPTDEAQVQWPPAPLVNHFSDFKGKSILVNKLSGSLDCDKSNKTVQFADGVRPGEGTSPSAGEELFSPPPPVLPKEKRFKKTSFGKKKAKKKSKAVKKPPTAESDSDDNLPPPSPPPGSPPPHVFPPRIKVKPVNNVPAALLASIIQTAQQQQFQQQQQYRPAINMMMAPPPPPPQGHHSQSPGLPPVSPQLHPGLVPSPQAGHGRHF